MCDLGQNTVCRGHLRRRRFGVTTAGLLVGSTILIGCAALALDLAFLMKHNMEARAATDAAALAGACELWDLTLLGGQSAEGTISREAAQNQQASAAQAQAQKLALANTVGHKRVSLSAKEMLINVAPATIGNSLTVRCEFTAQRRNPVTRAVGRLLGLAEVEMIVESQAVLDQRVCGFAPAGDVHVPMAPIIIDPKSWMSQCSSGVVTVTLHIEDGVESGAGRLCTLAPPSETGYAFSFEQIASGLTDTDLIRLPNQSFALDDSLPAGHLDLASTDLPGSTLILPEIQSGLASMAGRRLIWPLGSDFVTVESEVPTRRVEAFAAARVVHCSWNGSNEITIVVAPCLFATTTALCCASQPRNPWIGKVYLTH
jgi:hypothetical protein